RATLAVAFGTGMLDDAAQTVAGGTGALDGEEALLGAHLSLAAAGRTGDRLRAGCGAAALAFLTALRGCDLDLGIVAGEGLLERDLEIVAKIGAAALAGAAPLSHEIAEHLVEDVGEAGAEIELEAAGPSAATAAAFEGGMAEPVVGRALLVVAQHVVSFVDCLESLLGFRVAGIAIRMILHRQLAEGLLQIFLTGVAGHPELLVIVPLSHRLLFLIHH